MLYEVITLCRMRPDILLLQEAFAAPAADAGTAEHLAAALDVITSYSIHYAKLYELGPPGRTSRARGRSVEQQTKEADHR